MSEQMDDVNAALERDQAEDEYEGDVGDGARTRGTGAGIIGLGSGEAR